MNNKLSLRSGYVGLQSRDGSSNSDSQGSQINWVGQDKKNKLKAKRLRGKYLKSDESDESSRVKQKSSSETDSDDIEKNQKRSFQSNYDQGYRPLMGSYDYDKSKQRANSSIMSKPAGKGFKALDTDSDRTITENSENSSNEEYNNYKRTIPNSSGQLKHL